MEHIESEDCPCNPKVDLVQTDNGDVWIYTHRLVEEASSKRGTSTPHPAGG